MSKRAALNPPTLKLPSVPKAPRGWSTLDITIRGRGQSGANRLALQEPAGDPPPSWTGTRPEWAVYWALNTLGFVEGQDFQYTANLSGVETSYYSTVDFYLPNLHIGIEVQGSFWHYGLGSDKVYSDVLRKSLFAEQGVDVVFVDEPMALADPVFYVREALQGNDHSELSREY